MKGIVYRYGIGFGFITFILYVIAIILDYNGILNFYGFLFSGLVTIIVYTFIFVLAIYFVKKHQGGFIRFKEAFTTFFMASLTFIILNELYDYSFMNYFDKEYKKVVIEKTLKNIKKSYEMANIDDKIKKKNMKKFMKQEKFTLNSTIKNIFLDLMILNVIGLIVAAFMQRKEPMKIE